jgi:hypothetical protein
MERGVQEELAPRVVGRAEELAQLWYMLEPVANASCGCTESPGSASPPFSGLLPQRRERTGSLAWSSTAGPSSPPSAVWCMPLLWPPEQSFLLRRRPPERWLS